MAKVKPHNSEKRRHLDGPCGLWGEAEKRLIHSLIFVRAEPTARDLTAAIKQMYAEFPDAHEYDKNSIHNYFRSARFLTDRDQLMEEVRKETPKRGFSKRENRIQILQRVSEKMFTALDAMATVDILENAQKFQKICSELRSCLGEIREEISRIGGSSSEGVKSMAQELANDERRLADTKARQRKPGNHDDAVN